MERRQKVSVRTGSNRVNRGGSWNNTAQNCRSAKRNNNTPSNRNNNLGLRLCLPSAPWVPGYPMEQDSYLCRHTAGRSEGKKRGVVGCVDSHPTLPGFSSVCRSGTMLSSKKTIRYTMSAPKRAGTGPSAGKTTTIPRPLDYDCPSL